MKGQVHRSILVVLCMVVLSTITSLVVHAQGLAAAGIVASTTTPEVPSEGVFVEAAEFPGRVYFREETLRSFLRIPVPGPLDTVAIEQDRAEIEFRYRERGFLKARVEWRVWAGSGPKSVVVAFLIEAGDRADLLAVDVVGNDAVSDDELREGFFSRAPEPLGALTRAGFFHRPYLDQDGQRLIANYYQRGFLEARVTRTEVTATTDLDGLYVTLHVHEGPRYLVGKVSFIGDLPSGETSETLLAKLELSEGAVADLVRLQRAVDALLDPLREEGFPFARAEQQVVAADVVEEGEPTVSLLYQVHAGPQAQVREVLVQGNTGTLDHVVRRDVTITPGQTYSLSSLRETERRLLGTGFFSKVTARPVAVNSRSDVVDVEVTVTEQQTWLASLAPAWGGQLEGLVGIVLLADRNLLGTGVYGSVQGVFSGLRQLFDVQLVEPRLFGSRHRLSLSGHRREIGYLDFRTRAEGGGAVGLVSPLGAGFALTMNTLVEFGGVVPQGEDIPLETPLFPRSVLRNQLQLGALYDRRDSVLSPRNGLLVSLSTGYAGPYTLSGVEALETRGNLRLFWTPLFGITLKSNTTVALVTSPGGNDVPVTDRLFLGGFGSLRGFAIRTIGPRRPVLFEGGARREVRVGGVFSLLQNSELEFPLLPGFPLRGFLFLDAGNAFDDEENWFSDAIQRGPLVLPFGLGASSLVAGLHLSTGFGLVLETPVLPLRFEWGVPLNKRPGLDRDVDFFFGIGSAF
ncbi:MAG: outer membrane protein assembly factor BamA [Myxococcota bacterium]